MIDPYGSSLGEDVRSSLDFLVLRWVMAPKLVFGMISAMGNAPLRQHFRSSIALLALRMLPWLIIFNSIMAPFSGTLIC
jgi:hypothetical protein